MVQKQHKNKINVPTLTTVKQNNWLKTNYQDKHCTKIQVDNIVTTTTSKTNKNSLSTAKILNTKNVEQKILKTYRI